eukprot:TRINITY_DN357_c1_g1_i3.p1 TRINITY_DN357_c1_g1~~TRINITY_DN357_c1_g1_i3.p1  ORF type:complete len:2409 (-),score=504.45 TRINITY_DN357_c1_g1_i3:56-7282(-)
MANPVEKKFRERLKKFLTEKNPPKKWKAMTKIIDKETPENVTQLFLKHQDEIILTLVKFQQTLEQTKDNEKMKKQQELDALEVQRILKLVLDRLSNLVKTRFKYQEISQTIQRSLAKTNRHTVRKAAVESLMVFIEVLIQQPGREVDEMLLLFASSVILQVFVPDVASSTGAQIRVRNQPPTVEEGGSVCPSGLEPTVEEQKDLFASVLDFVASRVGKGNLFEFWFETVHRAYLVYLYPAVFQQLGSLPPGEADMGFAPFCPHPIQQVLIDKIESWKDNATICEMFFSDKFYPFSMEIFNQSCRLPITYLATIKKSLELFKYFLITKRRSNIVRDHLAQAFWRAYIQSMALVFTIDSTPAQSEGHAQLFQEVFSSVDLFTLQMTGMLEETTWKTLQYTLLDGTVSFLAKNAMSMLSDSKTDIVRMADPLISYLFSVWIRSPVTTPDMWRDLHVAFAQTTDWPHAVRQWKIKVLSLTEILIKFFHVRHAEYVMPTDLALEDNVAMFLGVPYWTKESISKMWYTVLNVSGNINHIKSAYNFEVAMKCVQEVVALLLQAEAAIPLREEPRRMPPIDVFMPWLMEACYATGEKIRGVIISYAVLCQLFCTQHSKQIAPELLSHFFRAIQVGLRSENPLVRDQIMSEARGLFTYDLPGSAVLIPEMLTEITNVFKVRQGATAEVQKNALSIFNSLICFPHHFKGVMVPDVSKSREINSNELREAISSLHLTISNTQNMAPAAKVMNIWGTCLMIFEEVNNEQPRINVLAACIQSIVTLTRHTNDIVSQAAGESLEVISAIFTQLCAIDRNLAYSTLSLMCDSVLAMFQDAAQSGGYKEPIMVLLYEAINMCLHHGPNDFLKDKNLATKFFTVIELGCLGQSTDPMKPSMTLSRVKTEEDLTTAPFYFLIEQLDMKPTHSMPGIKAVAEMLLHTVLNWYNNFPTPIGAAQLDSNVVEDVDRPMWAFTLNGEKIITFQSITDNSGSHAIRFVTRDAAGKHVWIFKHNTLPDQRFPIRNTFAEPPPPVVDLDSSQMQREAPKTKSPLLEMLQQFNHRHRDILPQTPNFVSFDSPILPDQSYASEIDGGKKLIDKAQKFDADTLARYKENRPVLDKDLFTPTEPLSGLAQARWLLSHFGFLGPHSRRVFHGLDDSAELRMALRQVDRLRSREHFNVGVLYVAAGQENISEYTQNRVTSVAFSHLVDGLGWKVDPRVHPGHRGDLGHEESPVLPYYSDSRTEIIFHVSSVMQGQNVPISDVLDSDHVQIVWSEHKRDFIMPKTLPGQGRDSLTDSYLVVYPLLNGMFRVQVQKRDTLTPFGPLMTGMVVTKRLLPSLLRTTSLVANRRSLKVRHPDWRHPMLERIQALRDLSNAQKKLRPPEIFFSHLFPIDLDAMASPISSRPGVQMEATRRRGDSLISRTAAAPSVSLPSSSALAKPSSAQAALPPAEVYQSNFGGYETTPQMAAMIMSMGKESASRPSSALATSPSGAGVGASTMERSDLEHFSYNSANSSAEIPISPRGTTPLNMSSGSVVTFSVGGGDTSVAGSPPGQQTLTFSVGSSAETPPSPRQPAGSVATPMAFHAVPSPSSVKTPGINRTMTNPSFSQPAPTPAAGNPPPSTMKRPIGAASVSGPRPMVNSPGAAPSPGATPPGIQPAGAKFAPMVNRSQSVAAGMGGSSPYAGALPPSNPISTQPTGTSAPITFMASSPPSNPSPIGSSPPGGGKQPLLANGRPIPVGAVQTPGMAVPPKMASPAPGPTPGGMTSPVGLNRAPASPLGAAPPRPTPNVPAPGPTGSNPVPPAASAPGPQGIARSPSAGLSRPVPGGPTPGVPSPAPTKAARERILPKLKASGHRVLMFSQMTATMNLMEEYFKMRGYTYMRLDGGVKSDDRGQLLADFNAPNSPYFIFILSTRAGGLGLNLQTADTVILFDSDWNPQADLQAQDRAHRIGQKNAVLVLRLCTINSIEERVLERANYKLDMDQKIIEAGMFHKNASAEDRRTFLLSLLKQTTEEEGQEEVPGDKEINDMIARSPEEYKLFQQMDKHREQLEKQQAERAGLPQPRPRLMVQEELPAWLLVDINKERQAKQEKAAEDYGRGRRARHVQTYADIDDEQFEQILIENDQAETAAADAKKAAKAARRAARLAGGVVSVDSMDDDDDDDDDDAGAGGVKRKRSEDTRTRDTATLIAPIFQRISSAVDPSDPSRRLCDLFTDASLEATGDYYSVVGEAISFNEIEAKFNNSEYKSPTQLYDDLKRLCTDAKNYSDSAESKWSRGADALEQLVDSEFQNYGIEVNKPIKKRRMATSNDDIAHRPVAAAAFGEEPSPFPSGPSASSSSSMYVATGVPRVASAAFAQPVDDNPFPSEPSPFPSAPVSSTYGQQYVNPGVAPVQQQPPQQQQQQQPAAPIKISLALPKK